MRWHWICCFMRTVQTLLLVRLHLPDVYMDVHTCHACLLRFSFAALKKQGPCRLWIEFYNIRISPIPINPISPNYKLSPLLILFYASYLFILWVYSCTCTVTQNLCAFTVDRVNTNMRLCLCLSSVQQES